MLVVVVTVVEEARAVETERGGWEVGGTAQKREGVADSAAVGTGRQFKLELSVGGLHTSLYSPSARMRSEGTTEALEIKGTARRGTPPAAEDDKLYSSL